jgi:hypothetical protein
MHAVDYVIYAGWAVFWVGWLAAALNTKASSGRATGWVGIRIVVIVVVFALVRAGSFNGHHSTVDDPVL